jgi:hypothetical protein
MQPGSEEAAVIQAKYRKLTQDLSEQTQTASPQRMPGREMSGDLSGQYARGWHPAC